MHSYIHVGQVEGVVAEINMTESAVEDETLFRKAFLNSEREKRYEARRAKYPLITERFPTKIGHIIAADSFKRWHWLAFRLATFNDERSFELLEKLLEKAKKTEGYEIESHGITNDWKECGKFFQKMWELQVAEYLRTTGWSISYCMPTKGGSPGGSPDFKAVKGEVTVYVECYFYTKSLGSHVMLELILAVLGCDLKVEWTRNVPQEGVDQDYKDAIKYILELKTLAEQRERAKIAYPVTIFSGKYIKVNLESDSKNAEYIPKENAHGDEKQSFSVFLREILENKEKKNGLAGKRPNILFVNSLSDNCQLAFSSAKEVGIDLCLLSENIDSMLLACVGVGKEITPDSIVKICGKEGGHAELFLTK